MSANTKIKRKNEKNNEFVIDKLDFTREEFNPLWNQNRKYYGDYPSYMPILNNYFEFSKSILSLLFHLIPSIFVEKQGWKSLR